MPDESPSKPPASDDPNSLANLLPEYFDDWDNHPTGSPQSGPVIPPTSPGLPPGLVAPPVRKATVKTKTRKEGFNYMALGIVAVVGVLIVPLLIFGVFVLIANLQPAQTTINVGAASTPLATVFSITPQPANATPAPTAKGTPAKSTVAPGNATPAKGTAAAANATPAHTTTAPASGGCPVQNAFDQVAFYSCARPVQVSSAFSGYFSLTELQLAQDGQNGPSARRYYAVTADSPAQVLSFYASLLPTQGYSPEGGSASGTAPLGNYSAAFYNKNGQQLQIVALSLNKASPDGQVNAGQTLIRLSAS
ncbi:MAG: hypothetical protein J0I20_16060 [Chloroflexi bacterium]|nr:hypothetical protein [Chloroflexota bacterium]OJV91191.1 MAG: hypothetical protein BGO39_26410 [Chloroflexi bacterium 54-19]